MGSDLQRPFSRGEYGKALVFNAVTEPFNALLFAGMLIAGIAIGQFAWIAPVAVVVYLIAIARTIFDKDEQEKVLAEARERRRSRIENAPRADITELGPPIAARVAAAREREARIRDAIQRADLPYDEVSDEVDAFVRAMEKTASRAELLYEALAETPRAEVEQRMRALGMDAAKAELREALSHQVSVLRRMETQLERFYDEMDRMTVELDTVRGNLVSVSASTESDAQRRLAGEVRDLREEMGALADGISAAYDK